MDDDNRTIVMKPSEERTVADIPSAAATGKVKGGNGILSRSAASITSAFIGKRKDVDAIIEASRASAAGSGTRFDMSGEGGRPSSNVDARYDRMEDFGEGGHAIVSLALDKSLHRLVALKSLREEFLSEESVIKGFIAEAKATAQLEHPSIIPIYSMESDSSDGLHLAMKLIKGTTLKDYISQIVFNYNREGAASFDERKSLSFRLDVFLRVCDAVSYAHSRNVMHCDLKPENIMIGEYRQAYVMDWGIAKLIEEPGFDPAKWVKPSHIAGTPKYISPEAIEGERTDHRADIFTLGLILFEIAALKPAIGGDDMAEVLQNIRYGTLEPMRHRFNGIHIDGDLKAIIAKATEVDRDRRYQSVADLAEDVRRYLRFAEVSAKPDNLLMKFVRNLYNHRILLAVVVLSALLLGATGLSFALYERMASMQLNRAREAAISSSHGKASYAAYNIDMLTLNLGNTLESIASETSFLLKWGHDAAPGRLFCYSDLDSPETAPKDLAYSPVYKRKISLDSFVYKIPPGGSFDSLRNELFKLSPMRKRFARAIAESGMDIPRLTITTARDTIMTRGMPVRWIYIGLDNGFFISYPGKGGYPASYDPRLRPWYKEGSASKSIKWASPYIDISGQGIMLPCTAPIFDDSSNFLGVAGLDMSFDYIVANLSLVGNTGPGVLEKLLVDSEGRVVVSTLSPLAGKTFSSDQMHNDIPQLPKFSDEALFNRMKQVGVGYMLRDEDGRETLYCFSTVQTLSWLYIEKLDFDKIMDAASKAESVR